MPFRSVLKDGSLTSYAAILLQNDFSRINIEINRQLATQNFILDPRNEYNFIKLLISYLNKITGESSDPATYINETFINRVSFLKRIYDYIKSSIGSKRRELFKNISIWVDDYKIRYIVFNIRFRFDDLQNMLIEKDPTYSTEFIFQSLEALSDYFNSIKEGASLSDYTVNELFMKHLEEHEIVYEFNLQAVIVFNLLFPELATSFDFEL